ncbi:MAG: exodeoxyribonuclease V subunit alpha, partial [Leptothrix sp. (in: b-proteobacteria)]
MTTPAHPTQPGLWPDDTMMPSPTPTSAQPQALLPRLKAWVGHGWLRRLDHALPAFLRDLDPASGDALLLASALLAHLEGRGHTCLPLADLVADADALLAWPAAALDELRAALPSWPTQVSTWTDALAASPLVAIDAAPDGAADVTVTVTAQGRAGAAAGQQPLVLRGDKLYLRRYWRHEQQVAQALSQRVAAGVAVDEAAARHWLARLFPPRANGEPGGLDWQQIACA